MLCVSVCLFVVAMISSTSGSTQLCSKSRSDVQCVQCKGEDTPFKCPKQCGGSRDQRLCDRVCSSNCMSSECEYDAGGVPLLCSQGCVDFYTGPFCSMHCMEGCHNCSQDNSLCFKCKRGRYGDTCKGKCDTCKDGDCTMDGTCNTGCEPGFYGAKCQKTCERCRKCGNEVSCDVCNRENGTCILGCDYGYYGPTCELPCGPRCTLCQSETGKCEQCENGSILKNGKCKRVKEEEQGGWNSDENPLAEEEERAGLNSDENALVEEEVAGLNSDENPLVDQTTSTTATMMSQISSTEISTETTTVLDEGRSKVTHTTPITEIDDAKLTQTNQIESDRNSVNDIDYLLPAVICLLIVFAATTLVLLWKLRSRFRVNYAERSDLEHKSLSKPAGPLSLSRSCPVYSDIPELKKKMAMASTRPLLLLPGDKTPTNLSRSGSTSTTYMTPVEDSEEDLFLQRTSAFGFVPQDLPERTTDHWKASAVTLDDGAMSLVFENDLDNQRPFRLKHNMIGSYEIPPEYLDKNASGRSTPRIIDM